MFREQGSVAGLCHKNIVTPESGYPVVFEGPVRSGYLPFLALTVTKTG